MSDQKQMDALVWLGPRQMEMQSIAIPVPAAGEVLIEVGMAGICGSELSGYLGHNSLRKPPLIMGHEAAGRVIQVTEGAFADGSPVREGTRVTFNPLVNCGECDRCLAGHPNLCRKRWIVGINKPGAFARFVVVPATQCFPLPEHVSDAVGAMAEPLACSVRAVSLAQVQPAQSLLILGAGPIGLFCLAAARAAGIERVYVSDLSPSRLAIAQRWGAREGINVREHDLLETVQTLVPGGADAVIDAVGANITRSQAVQAVVPGGQVVFIGLHEEASPLAANYLVRQEISITGSFAYTPPDFGRAFEFLTQGLLQPDDEWLETRPLEEGDAAFSALVDGSVAATKIVLQVGQ